DNVKFENQGYVYLSSVTTLPDNVKFENQGYVDLSSVTTLPDNVKFENQGYVYLRSVEGDVIYRGQSIHLKTIDGYTMVIGVERVSGEITIMNTRYFGGGELSKLKKCFVAQRGEYFAHGENLREAIDDVNFKYLQSSENIEEVVQAVKESKSVTVIQYRLLTGACQEGCRRFMEQHDLSPERESFPLDLILKLTAEAFGGERMHELFGEEVFAHR
ncbi:hypothetical protein MLD52_08980, partial [Puniceicoccaceae bacterium K14]|nr:hypothetical protein [Puniceicoccaceae bacterium K14]